jgi:hypothetical protein
LTLWVRPGMENRRCSGSSILFDVHSFKACVEYCAVDQGGPPRCGFVSYNPQNKHCHWSSRCDNTTVHHVPDAVNDGSEGEFSGVNQVLPNILLHLHPEHHYQMQCTTMRAT